MTRFEKNQIPQVRAIPLIGWGYFPSINREDLIEAAKNKKGTEYFQQFPLSIYINNNQPKIAYEEGIRILSECKIADRSSFDNIHKGGIYYWIGMAAFLERNYQTAVYFMDAAVSEDIRRGTDPDKDTSPAIKFPRIEGEPKEQAA